MVINRLWIPLSAALFLGACSYRPVNFAAGPVIHVMNDSRPGPVPEKNRFDFVYVGVDGLLRQPLVETMRTRRIPRSKDVNKLDRVPASSWYTPRLGYRNISPRELLHGPHQAGPPQRPVEVVKAKVGGGNPGFVIQDARGYKYLIKFDPPAFPGIETTTALIVNRLFWGFGYNVPEDYLFKFHRHELGLSPTGELDRESVDSVLSLVSPAVNGLYRSTASLYIPGTILGPIPETGTRKGDINDWIPHEDRRVLRALRVFCAFTHQSGIRPDNTLDVYEGEPGKGFTRHYLLDFGEAFGGHAAGKMRIWDGYEYFLSPEELLGSFIRPFRKKPWEEIKFTAWPAVGPFEAEIFQPGDWKETWRYAPFGRSLPDDDYWAAKIIASLTREHIEVLVKAAEYPGKEEEEYIIETLLKRKAKVLNYYFSRVTPLEPAGITKDRITLFFNKAGKRDENPAACSFSVMDETGKILAADKIVEEREGLISVPVDEKWWKGNNYIVLSVIALRKGVKSREAQFHYRLDGGGGLRLAGVLH